MSFWKGHESPSAWILQRAVLQISIILKSCGPIHYGQPPIHKIRLLKLLDKSANRQSEKGRDVSRVPATQFLPITIGQKKIAGNILSQTKNMSYNFSQITSKIYCQETDLTMGCDWFKDDLQFLAFSRTFHNSCRSVNVIIIIITSQ